MRGIFWSILEVHLQPILQGTDWRFWAFVYIIYMEHVGWQYLFGVSKRSYLGRKRGWTVLHTLVVCLDFKEYKRWFVALTKACTSIGPPCTSKDDKVD